MSNMPSADFWNARYSEAGFAYGETPNAFLVSVADQIKPGGLVLVPGDGEGRNGVWLARQGFDVTTVDMSQAGCDKAVALATQHGVTLNAICADLTQWVWPSSTYDAVISIFLHFMPPVRQTLHAKMRDSIKDDGVLIIEAFEPEHLALRTANPAVGGPDKAEMFYTPDMLAIDFAAMKARQIIIARILLDEGHYHKGESAVVRGVYTK